MKTKSFIAKVVAKTGLLSGGVKSNSSSRFERERHAQMWLDVIVGGSNGTAKIDKDQTGVFPSKLKPEIMAKDIEG